ncbi:hypothetical protein H632_c1254p0 [Helicosporidium sp. ATCC 50920]|nr:hypothetical protein H632_c1254p0 [Helicosporidium sp. ATCC 50920]|eukprot:KDD74525.1 hypothetical protein H632_c1254p0 [Helicosporidium sp. ATCC 50920]
MVVNNFQAAASSSPTPRWAEALGQILAAMFHPHSAGRLLSTLCNPLHWLFLANLVARAGLSQCRAALGEIALVFLALCGQASGTGGRWTSGGREKKGLFDEKVPLSSGWAKPSDRPPSKDGTASRADSVLKLSEKTAISASPELILSDLTRFNRAWDLDSSDPPSSSPAWEPLMRASLPGCAYEVWRRAGPGGRTEYRSRTLLADTSPREVADFFLDDERRRSWDFTLRRCDLERAADPYARTQVARWERALPLGLGARRSYRLAKRIFEDGDGQVLGLMADVSRAESRGEGAAWLESTSCYSAWCTRSVGRRGQPLLPAVDAASVASRDQATETLLFHAEDPGVSERLARAAVKTGTLPTLRRMLDSLQEFLEARRRRAGPLDRDWQAYGLEGAGGEARAGSNGAKENFCSNPAPERSRARRGLIGRWWAGESEEEASLSRDSRRGWTSETPASNRSAHSKQPDRRSVAVATALWGVAGAALGWTALMLIVGEGRAGGRRRSDRDSGVCDRDRKHRQKTSA